MEPLLKNKRGQTSLEYLLLLAATFISAYVVITGPLANFTRRMLLDLRGGIQNTVRNGEWKEGGDVAAPGDSRHPSNPGRTRPVHL